MEDMENARNEMEENKEQQLSEIAQALIANQGMITSQIYNKTISNLFLIVPDLETIQKDIRLKVSAHKYI